MFLSHALVSGIRRVGLVLALMLVLVPSTFGQSASRQLGPLSKRLSRVCVEKLCTITTMTDDQREQAMVLYEGYSSAHKQLLQDADDTSKVLLEDYRDGGPDKDWQEFAKKQRDILTKLFDAVRKARADFLTDVQTLLTREQQARWDLCERYMRREDTTRIGFMAGSMVDLVAIAEQTRVPREGDAANVLDQYEVAFDSVAKEWLVKLDGFFKEIKAADPTKEPDEKKMFGVLKEIMELSLKIRNVNRSYAKQLKDVLVDEHKTAFDKSYLAKAYPLVYDKRYVAKLFDKASALEVLSAQQVTELASLRESYERDVALVNAEWAKNIDERQEHLATDPQQFERSWDDGDAIQASRQARKELDTKTTERIRSLLDESLFADATKDLKRDEDIHNQDVLPDFDELEKSEEE